MPPKIPKALVVTIAFTACLPFAAFGIFMITRVLHGTSGNNYLHAIPFILFALVIGTLPFLQVFSILRKANKQQVAERSQPRDEKPWLVRADWAAGRIKSSSAAQWKIYLLMGIVFCGIGGAATFFGLKQELPKGNYAVLFVLFFPMAGIGLLTAAIRGVLAQRRFGDCYFEMASIPGALGGTLEGLIQTGTRLNLQHGLHLSLACVRITVSGSGDNRSRHENILWQDEKVFNPHANFPETEPGRSGIPIFFKLPADQPESQPRGGETIAWRLTAKAKTAGPGFSAIFDVPIFKVAGAAAADEPDPTSSLQMPVAELRRDEHSKIQMTNGPGGHEFYFPAARNLGSAVMVTFFLAIWSSFLWFMIVKRAPILFPIVFGLFEIFILWGCFSLWFKSSRVTVNSSGVTAKNRWLIFSRTRQFDAGKIVRFATKVGMTSGSQMFQDLKLVTRAGEDDFAARKTRFQQTGERPPLDLRVSNPVGITLASGLASKPEADWLVQEMTKALGRKV